MERTRSIVSNTGMLYATAYIYKISKERKKERKNKNNTQFLMPVTRKILKRRMCSRLEESSVNARAR